MTGPDVGQVGLEGKRLEDIEPGPGDWPARRQQPTPAGLR
jgi:hypothetical protein